ncbi:ATP-dependent RNA helicase DBP1 [Orchesella cincta]|uniref:RNA helicase n=1 Tax=Orchesella cincta TaxID=48709 RepID=A0A1D2MVN9_ORCCI|nr:ATP-dependent RNA helicase DBP1 [Orchesella cincta]
MNISNNTGGGYKYKLNCEGEELDYNTERDVHYCIRGANKQNGIISFADPHLGLDSRLLDNVTKAGLKKPTPIQRHGMPQLMAGLDVMCCSHTGSGKTAAYLLPIINQIVQAASLGGRAESTTPTPSSSRPENEKKSVTRPLALILTPTHELAMQISKDANVFGKGMPIQSFAVFGGQPLGFELRRLKDGTANILVATPGKLLHLLSEFKVVSLEKVQFFVVDEADEMFDRGFFPQIGDIVNQFLSPKEERVNALFSATFPNQIQYFAKKQLKPDYIFVVIGILGGASPDVCQEIVCASRAEKQMKLCQIVQNLEDEDKKVLVFCNKIEKVNDVADILLLRGFKAGRIHSELTQPERTQALRDFDEGKTTILVATSVAARGLNIRGMDLVLNYELPRDITDYIQRIGRTGRVGVAGETISFFDEDTDAELVQELVDALKTGNQKVPSFLSDLCAEAGNDNEYESEDDLHFKMKKLNIKKCLDVFEEEDAW